MSCENCADLQSLFDMQHRREMEAIARWRAEAPKARSLTMPDYGRLLDWLWDRVQMLEKGGNPRDTRALTYDEAVAEFGKTYADTLEYNPGEGPPSSP